jgi:23S rRNA (cytosine1962-C5)-methyltransferase
MASPRPASRHRSPQRPRPRDPEPRIRRGAVRLPAEIAGHVRAGHPLVFREALGPRALSGQAGEPIDLLDADGQLVGRGLFDPTGPVAVRVVTRDPGQVIGPELWAGRVAAAVARRRDLVPPGLTAYRVIHAEGDGLPGLTVDQYGEYLVAQIFAPSIEPHLPAIYDALEASLAPRAIYAQSRQRPQAGEGAQGPATLQRGSVAPVELEVEEDGLRFLVDVTAPLGTGLFLDLRRGRALVGAHARDRRVLNLFSYTGAFSVYAARGGAREVVAIDLSQRAHARARRNFEINGLDAARHEPIAGDAFKVLARMAERGRRFELAIVDPPSFAQGRQKPQRSEQSKEKATGSKGGVFSVQRDYPELVEATLRVCAPGARVAFVSNTMKVSPQELDRAIGVGAYRAGREVRVIERVGLPPDFPLPAGYIDGHYLKFFFTTVD